MFVCSQLQGLQIFQHSLVRRTVEQIARLEYDSVSTEVEGLAPPQIEMIRTRCGRPHALGQPAQKYRDRRDCRRHCDPEHVQLDHGRVGLLRTSGACTNDTLIRSLTAQ